MKTFILQAELTCRDDSNNGVVLWVARNLLLIMFEVGIITIFEKKQVESRELDLPLPETIP